MRLMPVVTTALRQRATTLTGDPDGIRRLVRPSRRAPTLPLAPYRLTPKRRLKGFWGVTISGNWRIVFRLENANAFDVDLIDYH